MTDKIWVRDVEYIGLGLYADNGVKGIADLLQTACEEEAKGLRKGMYLAIDKDHDEHLLVLRWDRLEDDFELQARERMEKAEADRALEAELKELARLKKKYED